MRKRPTTWTAVPAWAKQLSDALQALDDDAGQKGLPHFTQTFDIEMSSVLHGATSCMPDGLTRSMEEEFKNNDGGEWEAEYNGGAAGRLRPRNRPGDPGLPAVEQAAAGCRVKVW